MAVRRFAPSSVSVDVAIIGGGIVGLACGAALAARNLRTIVIERHAKAGTESTSRNSQVIHAGLYYEPGSLKAELCVRGATLLYEYCARRHVAHRKTGKLVVAESAELPLLERLATRAAHNGAKVTFASAARVHALEPDVRAAGALESPDSGIVDSHGIVGALAADLAAHEGILALGRNVVVAEHDGGAYVLRCEGVVGVEHIEATTVVNAAGLAADHVASLFGLDVDACGYRQRIVKGSYFRIKGRPPVRRLVYPMPPADGEGLGIHATVELDGTVRLGPDAEPITTVDYSVDEGRRDAFHRAACRYLPALRATDLEPDMAGVRSKLARGSDFIVAEESARGLPGLFNLVGIESPGLTAALAIAERVACAMVKG